MSKFSSNFPACCCRLRRSPIEATSGLPSGALALGVIIPQLGREECSCVCLCQGVIIRLITIAAVIHASEFLMPEVL